MFSTDYLCVCVCMCMYVGGKGPRLTNPSSRRRTAGRQQPKSNNNPTHEHTHTRHKSEGLGRRVRWGTRDTERKREGETHITQAVESNSAVTAEGEKIRQTHVEVAIDAMDMGLETDNPTCTVTYTKRTWIHEPPCLNTRLFFHIDNKATLITKDTLQ